MVNYCCFVQGRLNGELLLFCALICSNFHVTSRQEIPRSYRKAHCAGYIHLRNENT